MKILAIGKITTNTENEDKSSEVTYDGRLIGTFIYSGEDNYRLDQLESASEEDIKSASQIATESFGKSLSSYIHDTFQVQLLKDNALKRMRNRLKKSTLFFVAHKKIQLIDQKYNENVRSYIHKNHPDAIILNTLSEEDAFSYYYHPTEK